MARNDILKVAAGPILGLMAFLLFPESGPIARVAGVGVWMAVWWITEAVSLYFTALLPLMLFPLLGIAPMTAVGPEYTREVIFLFIGGFLIAFGLERWGLHRRIALRLILLTGATSGGILAGIMLAAFCLSMWISNTATVTTLLPAVLAVVRQLEERHPSGRSALSTPYLLGLAYAASIGGMATIVGTPPNLILMSFYNERFPGDPITFANWLAFGFPLSAVLLVCCWLILRWIFRDAFRREQIDVEGCRREYRLLGPLSYEERWLSSVFAITVVLWFFMKDLAIGSVTIPGWTTFAWFSGHSDHIRESTIAMLMAGILYVIPARRESGGLIRWAEVQRLPVGIIFLFGGGFALASAFESSGLSQWIAGGLSIVGTLPPVLVVLTLCFFTTFLTEIMSNSASVILLLPVLASFVHSIGIEPLLIFVPVVISATCAFMLPVATPPNTIVFATERISIRNMVRTGIWLNLTFAVLITLATFTVVRWTL
jgi:sodium-dependent dicarboxylate transporter 2/3/5